MLDQLKQKLTLLTFLLGIIVTFSIFSGIGFTQGSPLVVTSDNIQVSISTDNNDNGIANPGDILTVTWDNSAEGDANTIDITEVTVDFSAVGVAEDNTAISANDNGLDCDESGEDGIWTACYEVDIGSDENAVDGEDVSFTITVFDIDGNSAEGTTGNTVFVDNKFPEVESAQTTSVTTIEIEFSEDIDAGSVLIEDFFVSDDSQDYDVTDVSVDENVVTLTIDPELTADAATETTGLFVEIISETTVKDLAGNEFSGVLDVEDGVEPSLLSSNPTNNVLLNETPEEIIFTFSESIDSFEMEMMLDDEPVFAQFGESGAQVIFNDLDVLGSLELGDHEVEITVIDFNGDEEEFEIEFTLLPPGTEIINSTIENSVENFEFDAEGTDTTLILNTSGSTDLFVAAIDEPSGNFGVFGINKFTEITVSNSSAIIFPIEIRIFYTDEELASAGIDESSLRIHFFNKTNNTWQIEPNSSVDTVNNFVFALVNHLSIYGAYGLQAPPPQTSPPPKTVQREMGGCSYYYTLSSPSSVDSNPGSSVTIPVTVSNKGCRVTVTVSAEVPAGWSATSGKTKQLYANELEDTVYITVTIPNNAATSSVSFTGTFGEGQMGRTNTATTTVNILPTPAQESPAPETIPASASQSVVPTGQFVVGPGSILIGIVSLVALFAGYYIFSRIRKKQFQV